MDAFIPRELAPDGFSTCFVLLSPEQTRLNQLRLCVIGRETQAILYAARRLIQTMASLVEHGQFEKRVRNISVQGQCTAKTLDGLVRPKNHSITLAGQMQDLRITARECEQAVEQCFGTSDFEPCAQRATRVN